LTVCPTEKVIVSLAYVDEARGWAVALEDQTARQEGLTVAAARPIVAREVGVAPGTLENLRKGRLKGLAKHVYDALQAATVRRLQNQLKRLLHEQHLLTQQGEDHRSNDAQAVLADIEAVRRALGLPASSEAP
jgi:hypothetical protein